jgi:hypothetical protein
LLAIMPFFHPSPQICGVDYLHRWMRNLLLTAFKKIPNFATQVRKICQPRIREPRGHDQCPIKRERQRDFRTEDRSTIGRLFMKVRISSLTLL